MSRYWKSSVLFYFTNAIITKIRAAIIYFGIGLFNNMCNSSFDTWLYVGGGGGGGTIRKVSGYPQWRNATKYSWFIWYLVTIPTNIPYLLSTLYMLFISRFSLMKVMKTPFLMDYVDYCSAGPSALRWCLSGRVLLWRANGLPICHGVCLSLSATDARGMFADHVIGVSSFWHFDKTQTWSCLESTTRTRDFDINKRIWFKCTYVIMNKEVWE